MVEDSTSALDSFMSFKSESVSVDVTAGGPSYLTLIKSRYVVDVANTIAEKPQASVAFEAWKEDFINSNNLTLMPNEMGHHSHCEHIHACDHQHDIPEKNCEIEGIEDIEYDDVEQISLVSSLLNANNSASLIHMNNKLKVDNFYIDGESESFEALNLCGYMPSGLNSSALQDEASDSEDSELPQSTSLAVDAAILEELHDYIDTTQNVEGIDQALNNLELNTQASSGDLNSPKTSNMTLLQRAYQAEQRRDIETLSCSESEDEHAEHSEHFDEGNNTATEPEPLNMAEALAEFQKFSARYRDIDSSELLHSIQSQYNDTTVFHSTIDVHEVGSRWYDDVEEFVEEP